VTRDTKKTTIVLFLVCEIIRFSYMLLEIPAKPIQLTGEPQRVAVSLLETGNFANPYRLETARDRAHSAFATAAPDSVEWHPSCLWPWRHGRESQRDFELDILFASSLANANPGCRDGLLPSRWNFGGADLHLDSG